MEAITEIDPTIDPRINVSHEYAKHVELIPANVQYNLTSSDGSNGFESQIVFSQIITPSVSNTVLSRDVRVLYNLAVSAPSPTTDPKCIKLPQVNYDASYEQHAVLTSFPLQASATTITVQINGQSTGVSQQQIFGSLLRTLDKKKLMNQGTECPSLPDDRAVLTNDVAQTAYVKFPAAFAAGQVPLVDGSGNVLTYAGVAVIITLLANGAATRAASPLPVTCNGVTVGQFIYNYADAAFPSNKLVKVSLPSILSCNTVSNQVMSKFENSLHSTRGSFKPISFNDDGTTATWNFLVSEPIVVSPFTPMEDNDIAIANVNTMSITFTMGNLLSMLYSNVPFTTPSLLITNPRIQLTYLQLESIKIPRVQVLDYTAINYFPKSYAIDLSSGSQSLSTDQVRLTNQPRKIIFGVRLPLANRYQTAIGVTNSATDTFLSFGSPSNGAGQMSIQIGTRQLFSSASLETLYRISKKNGLNCNFADWLYGGQCLFIFTPADFGLSEAQGDVFPGQLGTSSNNNLQINFTINAQSLAYAGLPTGAQTAESIIVVMYEGTCNVSPSDCLFNLGSLSQSQVAKALGSFDKVPTNVVTGEASGAGLFGNVKKVFGMGAKGLMAAHKALSSDVGQKVLGYLADGSGLKMKKGKKGGVLSSA